MNIYELQLKYPYDPDSGEQESFTAFTSEDEDKTDKLSEVFGTGECLQEEIETPIQMTIDDDDRTAFYADLQINPVTMVSEKLKKAIENVKCPYVEFFEMEIENSDDNTPAYYALNITKVFPFERKGEEKINFKNKKDGEVNDLFYFSPRPELFVSEKLKTEIEKMGIKTFRFIEYKVI